MCLKCGKLVNCDYKKKVVKTKGKAVKCEFVVFGCGCIQLLSKDVILHYCEKHKNLNDPAGEGEVIAHKITVEDF
jgi:hypothetical protein